MPHPIASPLVKDLRPEPGLGLDEIGRSRPISPRYLAATGSLLLLSRRGFRCNRSVGSFLASWHPR